MNKVLIEKDNQTKLGYIKANIDSKNQATLSLFDTSGWVDITTNSLSSYYTKSETSSITQLNNTFDSKQNIITTNNKLDYSLLSETNLYLSGTVTASDFITSGNIKLSEIGYGYFRKIVSSATILNNKDWALVNTNCTVTLPSAIPSSYVVISTVGENADNVVIIPVTGDTIQGDSEGITIDQKRLKLQLFCGVSGTWIISEVR